jgi:carboxylate-amine ligase
VTDVCSRAEDAACVAALFQSLMAFLYRLRTRNQRWRIYPATLIRENRWRAQRYGTKGKLVDHGRGVLAPFADLIEELIDLLGQDAEALGCKAELLHARRIAREGTSADRQRAVHEKALAAGAEPQEALQAVVDALIGEFTGT